MSCLRVLINCYFLKNKQGQGVCIQEPSGDRQGTAGRLRVLVSPLTVRFIGKAGERHRSIPIVPTHLGSYVTCMWHSFFYYCCCLFYLSLFFAFYFFLRGACFFYLFFRVFCVLQIIIISMNCQTYLSLDLYIQMPYIKRLFSLICSIYKSVLKYSLGIHEKKPVYSCGNALHSFKGIKRFTFHFNFISVHCTQFIFFKSLSSINIFAKQK